jgi:hypothetical protein
MSEGYAMLKALREALRNRSVSFGLKLEEVLSVSRMIHITGRMSVSLRNRREEETRDEEQKRGGVQGWGTGERRRPGVRNRREEETRDVEQERGGSRVEEYGRGGEKGQGVREERREREGP